MIDKFDATYNIKLKKNPTNIGKNLSSLPEITDEINMGGPTNYEYATNLIRYIQIHYHIKSITKRYLPPKDSDMVLYLLYDNKNKEVITKIETKSVLPNNCIPIVDLDCYEKVLKEVGYENLVFYLTFNI